MPARKVDERLICASCNEYLPGSTCGRRLKDGRRILYYDCRFCERRFKSIAGGPIQAVKKIQAAVSNTTHDLSNDSRVVRGARVFIDGKFVGVAK